MKRQRQVRRTHAPSSQMKKSMIHTTPTRTNAVTLHEAATRSTHSTVFFSVLSCAAH